MDNWDTRNFAVYNPGSHTAVAVALAVAVAAVAFADNFLRNIHLFGNSPFFVTLCSLRQGWCAVRFPVRKELGAER